MVAAGAVPAPVASRVRRVDQVVRDTIPRLPSLGAGSPQAYSVMATATDYLPEAVGGYLRLPRQFADSRPVDRGKSSLMILIDQLDLLAATMDQVFDAVCREDADALVAHGQFLAEKFRVASTGGVLDVGSAPVPPMPESRGGGGRQASLRQARQPRTPVAWGDFSRLPDGTPRGAHPTPPPHRAHRRSLRPSRRGCAGRDSRGRPEAARQEPSPSPQRWQVAPRAAADWGLAAPGASTQDFFDAASRGRRWRDAPTATLGSLVAESPHARDYADALAEVASAACQLGEADAGHRQRVRRRRSPCRQSPLASSSGPQPPVASVVDASAPFARATRRYLLTARPATRAAPGPSGGGVDELSRAWTP